MAGLIPQHFIDELIARADIVEVIGSRVPLKKAGREFKACCPFHGEKTPSFTVSQVKQFYHCFGCGAHGTALGFLMEYDKLGFIEAVEELASRLGLEVPREAGAKRDSSSDDLYEVLGRAAQFFRDTLKDNARATDYLKKRGLSDDTALQFGIGYAPDSWNALLKRFGANDAARRKLSAAGLTVERTGPGPARDSDGGFYDRFRDRIMFPIRDARGRVIAFGGRIIDSGEPKYMNSPETSVFHKGKELYGLYEARQTRQALARLLIVEGYMDVVRLHQAGVTYALATLGTATTTEHLNRIFRLTSEVVFCFDGDRAGRAAAWRALENALPQAREGRQIRFMFLPEGQDPDSLVGTEGREAFEARLSGALPLSEYLVEQLASQVDLEHLDGRARLAELARPLLKRIPAGVYQELLIDRLAKQVGMPAGRLAALLLEPGEAKRPGPAKPVSKATLAAGRGSLVRQAITLLLNHPEAAKPITGAEELAQSPQPGAALLAELISELKMRPAPHKAAVVERWRDRPDGTHLLKLAAAECLVADAKAAARDVQVTVDRIKRESGPSRRTDELLRKAEESGLTSQEKLELQGLLAARGGRGDARREG